MALERMWYYSGCDNIPNVKRTGYLHIRGLHLSLMTKRVLIVLLVILATLAWVSCDYRPVTDYDGQQWYGNGAELAIVQPDNTVVRHSLYSRSNTEEFIHLVDEAHAVHGDSNSYYLIDVGNWVQVETDNGYGIGTIAQESIDSFVVRLATTPQLLGRLNALQFDSRLIAISDSLWRIDGSGASIHRLNTALEPGDTRLNPYADQAGEDLRAARVIGDHIYMLIKHSPAGFHVRVTDLHFNEVNFVALNSHHLVTGLMAKPASASESASVSIVCLTDLSYNGTDMNYQVTEYSITSSTHSTHARSWSNMPDPVSAWTRHIGNSGHASTDTGVIAQRTTDYIYVFDRQTDTGTRLPIASIDPGLDEEFSYMIDLDSQGRVIIAYPGHILYEGYQDTSEVTLQWFDTDLSPLRHTRIALEGAANRELLSLSVDSSDQPHLVYATTY